jgi:hypothetical protein
VKTTPNILGGSNHFGVGYHKTIEKKKGSIRIRRLAGLACNLAALDKSW